MISLAAQHGIRLVAPNLRGYPSSTPFSAEELAVIQRGEFASQDAFFAARGGEISAFLSWFIREHDIPPLSVVASADGRTESLAGGVALLGWSYGTVTALAFLAHAHKLTEETQYFFEGYLRTCILYGKHVALCVHRNSDIEMT